MAQTLGHNLGTLILRLSLGGFMAYGHGWGKMNRLFSGEEIRFADPFGLGMETSLALAAGAELVCAGLLALGVLTRLNLIPLVITMLVAAFIAHGGDPFGDKEMALLYLTGYLGLFLLGPGDWTVQRLVAPKLANKPGAMGFLLR